MPTSPTARRSEVARLLRSMCYNIHARLGACPGAGAARVMHAHWVGQPGGLRGKGTLRSAWACSALVRSQIEVEDGGDD
jgi:hypothetical protein